MIPFLLFSSLFSSRNISVFELAELVFLYCLVLRCTDGLAILLFGFVSLYYASLIVDIDSMTGHPTLLWVMTAA